MTDILKPVIAPALDDASPLARLFAVVSELDAHTEAKQREDAELAAAHHVYNAYPGTVGQVLDSEAWTGQAAVKDNRLAASAVAWLQGGSWLHHILHISENDGAHDVLTLIAPCACDGGYVDFRLEDEDDLLEILNDLRRSHGRVPHHDGECTSVPDPHAPTTK
ncbi:hypothetical protein [Streptomyces hilarionis]|uniref:hypothetical protein n=1 Tax=Streptomyces hilarionis TaxID=2839954 RepID=UPI00211A52DB|nr:hypothetical protein [Streptomyces hilarionis]MCQ9134589.1 hypothetical protein [Streptomyces hilarionis]